MIKLTKVGLVTDEAQVASMFLVGQDEEGIRVVGISGVNVTHLGAQCWPITIPWPTVKAAIQPVEGEGFVGDAPELDRFGLTVYQNYNEYEREALIYWKLYHKRVLNIVTTRAELRDLVKHVEEAKGCS